MITNSELTKLKPKRIVYNNISYYIRFSLKNDIGSGSYPYIIQLYEQIKDPINKIFNSIIIYDSSKQTVEEADISQNYKLVFTSPINTVIKKLEQVDSAAIHSPTYIQDIIETFF